MDDLKIDMLRKITPELLEKSGRVILPVILNAVTATLEMHLQKLTEMRDIIGRLRDIASRSDEK